MKNIEREEVQDILASHFIGCLGTDNAYKKIFALAVKEVDTVNGIVYLKRDGYKE